MVLGDVPGLPDPGAAFHRLEFVAPDAPADELPTNPRGRVCQAMRRFSSNSMTVLTME